MLLILLRQDRLPAMEYWIEEGLTLTLARGWAFGGLSSRAQGDLYQGNEFLLLKSSC